MRGDKAKEFIANAPSAGVSEPMAVGVLLNVGASALQFVLQPETLSVFVAWVQSHVPEASGFESSTYEELLVAAEDFLAANSIAIKKEGLN